ncbi:MAG: hypothetical protein Q9160_002813 [Pyrenula sp. 1 TL-2023]
MSEAINLSRPSRPLHVGVILVSDATELLDIAPIDMLNSLRREFIGPEFPIKQNLKDQTIDMQIHWVAETASHPRGLTAGLSVTVTDTFSTCPPLDIALIGAGPMNYTPTASELSFIRTAYSTSTAFLTVCGGVEYALRAGILAGKTATGPRPMIPMMRKMAPDVKWEERRWCRDGKLWTSGALVNGLDMMREFIEESWGGEGSLARFLAGAGSAPVRDRDYRDEEEVDGMGWEWGLPGDNDGVAA